MSAAQIPAGGSSFAGNNFDAIRIVAASMVLISHHYALTGQMEPSFFGIHSYGGLAVAIFFIISGYLVAASWQRDPNFLRFALRRFLRIWPALTAALVLTAYGLGALVTELPLKDYITHRATANYLQGLWMKIHFVLPGVFEENPYPKGVNGSLWTIPIEVRCYIILALGGLIGLLKYRPILLICIFIYFAWFFQKYNADLTKIVSYNWELSAFFAAGVALQTLEKNWTRHPALWAGAIATATAISWTANLHHTALLIGLPFFIIYLGTRSTPFIRKAGHWGDPSYGIYLFAFPIQQTIIFYLFPSQGFLVTLFFAFLATTFLAYLSWHGLEKQFLKFKPSTKKTALSCSSPLNFFKNKNRQLTELQRFGFLLVALSLAYAVWMIACWPGVLGQDSLAIMLEVDTDRGFSSGKPSFWYAYNLLLYGTWGLTEIPIIFQMTLCAIVCARILGWMLSHEMYKSFIYCLFFVALAPSVIYYSSSLYGDGVYAMASIGMLFEVWRCYKARKIDHAAVWMLFLTIPFALFARPNGIISIVAIVALATISSTRDRWKLAAILLPWCASAILASTYFQRESHGAIFPLALYETVGFLEHRPMGLWERNEPRVTPQTLDALTSNGESIDRINQYYDHYYWDPLVYFNDGPNLMSLSSKAKKTIIREFFTYNLWHNLPAFTASRINIFLYSAFANGGIPGLASAEIILNKTKSLSQPRFRNGAIHRAISSWFDFSLAYRFILWTPWLGLFLVATGSVRTWRHKDHGSFIICSTLTLHLIAVFIFSIAGEYRYLLTFFAAPMILLPVLYSQTSSTGYLNSTASSTLGKNS